MSSSRFLVCAAVLAALATSTTAEGQEPSREREALRRMQQQVSKLQQQNAVLEREKGELDQKLKAAEADIAKLKADLGKAKRTGAALSVAEKDNADLRTKLTGTEERLKETTQKCQEQSATLQKAVGDGKAALAQTRQENERAVGTLQGQLRAETERAGVCETKNEQLYSVTTDLIDRYKQNRGVWEKFLIAEPFTGLKSVEVENLLEDFREKAVAQKVAPRKD